MLRVLCQQFDQVVLQLLLFSFFLARDLRLAGLVGFAVVFSFVNSEDSIFDLTAFFFAFDFLFLGAFVSFSTISSSTFLTFFVAFFFFLAIIIASDIQW